jgi:hypothetical protein
MTSETVLSAESLVPFLLSVIASGESLTADEVAEIRRLDAAREELREAARSVVVNAEPDIAYEGEGFVDYLVPFAAIDALRAAIEPGDQHGT